MRFMNQQHMLTFRPVMWLLDHPGARTETDPPFRYEVSDEWGRTVGYITNPRATGHPQCWEISRLGSDGRIGPSTGEYTTAEEALSAFQQEFTSGKPQQEIGARLTDDGRNVQLPEDKQKQQYGDKW